MVGRVFAKWLLVMAIPAVLFWWLMTRPHFIEAEGSGVTEQEARSAAYNELAARFVVKVKVLTTSKFAIGQTVIDEFTQRVRQHSEANLVGVTDSGCVIEDSFVQDNRES